MKKLSAIIMVLCILLGSGLTGYAQTADKSPNVPAPKTQKAEPIVPENIEVSGSYKVEKAKNYGLPEKIKKTGNTYQSSNDVIFIIDEKTGKITTLAYGVAYIIAINDETKTYYKLTVGSGVFSGKQGKLSDYTDPKDAKLFEAVLIEIAKEEAKKAGLEWSESAKQLWEEDRFEPDEVEGLKSTVYLTNARLKKLNTIYNSKTSCYDVTMLKQADDPDALARDLFSDIFEHFKKKDGKIVKIAVEDHSVPEKLLFIFPTVKYVESSSKKITSRAIMFYTHIIE